ncbi:MAG: hypothetical protein ACP5TO_01585 [Thermoplasmata archaeon]
MKLLALILIIQVILLSGMNLSYAQTVSVNMHTSVGANATQNLTEMLNRLTFVINAIAISILSILWIWEGLFLFFHKDDREGILKFKHDLPIMIIASVIILGASVIVNIIGFIAHG